MSIRNSAFLFGVLILFSASSACLAAGSNQWTAARPMPSTGRASYGNYVASSRDIKSMPLLSRPDRPGHFIGNTIRRAYRQNGR